MSLKGRQSISTLESIFWDFINENFPNLARQANIQIQEMQRTPVRYLMRKSCPRYIIIRFSNADIKEKMLKTPGEKGQSPTSLSEEEQTLYKS